MDKSELVVTLDDIEAVKFGSYKLKSGIISPIYFDIRVLVSYSKHLAAAAKLMYMAAKEADVNFDCLCGVPYTALPVATWITLNHEVPMVLRRKETKDYGCRNLVEGRFQPGQKCLIFEDVISSGSSVLETAEVLRSVGLVVTDAVVLLDREQGGRLFLAEHGIRVHSVFTLTSFLSSLVNAGRISFAVAEDVMSFMKSTSALPSPSKVVTHGQRAQSARNPVVRRLFSIMSEKKTNLAVALDVTSMTQLLKMAELLGPYICILKTHADMIDDFSLEKAAALRSIAKQHDFLIFEDRKFADIGNTVMAQFSGGLHRIASWADLINAHTIPGPGTVDGLAKAVPTDRHVACLLIAEMSSKGCLIDERYKSATVSFAENRADFVAGFISTSRVSTNPDFVHLVPGVKLEEGNDALGQRYLTPEEVVTQRCCDVIIVGRGIYEADDPVAAAAKYRRRGIEAYLHTLS